MILAKDRTSYYEIHLRSSASETEIFAAKELSNYINKASLTKLDITIEVEDYPFPLILVSEPDDLTFDLAELSSKVASLDKSGYSISVSDNNLIIASKDMRGILTGIYAFLEKFLRIRWPSWGKETEVIPYSPVISLDSVDIQSNPDFSHRSFTNYSPIDERVNLMIDWMGKNRLSCFMINLNLGESFEQSRGMIIPQIKRRGLDLEASHHSFYYWIPPKDYFEKHPQYFSLIDGKRNPNSQLCLSNPELVQEVIDRILSFIRRNPSIDIIGLYPNDRFGWCECENCKPPESSDQSGFKWIADTTDKTGGDFESFWAQQPSYSNLYFSFIKQVADAISKEYPDKLISSLAYHNYIDPPVDLDLPENVIVTFAPFRRCVKHSLYHESCPRNNRYRELLEKWREITKGPLILFEYYLFPDYLSLPYPAWNILAQDLKYHKKNRINGFVLEYKPEEWAQYNLTAYAYSRLCWETEQKVEDIVADYCRAYYGEAGEAMFNYFTTFKEGVESDDSCCLYYSPDYLKTIPYKLLAKCEGYLEKAFEISNGQMKRRVNRAKVNFEYARSIRSALLLTDEMEEDLKNGRKEEAKTKLREIISSYEEAGGIAREGGFLDVFYLPRIEEFIRMQLGKYRSEYSKL